MLAEVPHYHYHHGGEKHGGKKAQGGEDVNAPRSHIKAQGKDKNRGKGGDKKDSRITDFVYHKAAYKAGKCEQNKKVGNKGGAAGFRVKAVYIPKVKPCPAHRTHFHRHYEPQGYRKNPDRGDFKGGKEAHFCGGGGVALGAFGRGVFRETGEKGGNEQEQYERYRKKVSVTPVQRHRQNARRPWAQDRANTKGKMQKAHKQRRPRLKQLGGKGVGAYLKKTESGENQKERAGNRPEAKHEKHAHQSREHKNKPRGEGFFNPDTSNKYAPNKGEQHTARRQEGNHQPLPLVRNAEFRINEGVRDSFDVRGISQKKHNPVKDHKEQ